MADAPDTPLINAQGVAIVVKVLTDYPRDDLASDEVHQSLIAALVRRGVVVREADVGSVPGMDTVVAGFKTAQLALNSTLGPGHVFHTNCAPRKHIVSARSQGERVVLGILDSGVALILVNSGYTLAPFKPLIEGGRAWFFESRVPDSGSQFRSRDYFPDATAAVARHLQDRLSELGPEKLSARLAAGEAATLLDGLALKAEPLPDP